jgi:photosystem II stability/assembly factor-like uncharacterized protein
MVADGAAPGTVFAGLATGAVYRSTDAGRSWSLLGPLPRLGAVNVLAQDPENAARLFAATSAGGFVSPDSGGSWKDLEIGGAAGIPVLTLAIDPWTPAVMFAGTRGRGMFRSADGGATWSPIVSPVDATFSFSDVYDIDIDLQKPDIVYAAVGGIGVVGSTDAGASWTRLTPEASPTGSAITSVLVRRNAGTEILYGTAAGAIHRSVDRGETWTPARRGGEGDRILSLESAHRTPEIVFAGTTTGVIRSTDFGATWTPVADSLPRVPISVALPHAESDRTVYLYGEGLGVAASPDNLTTWFRAQRGPGGSTVTHILTDRSGEHVYASAGGTVLRRDAATGTWAPAGSGLTGGRVASFAFDPDSAGGIYAATPSGVYRTSNGGESWRAVPRRLPVSPVFLDTHPTIATRVFASGEQGLFVSTDRGNSWGQVKPLGNKFSVRSLTFAPTNAGIIFGAGTTGVITTTDGGISWTPTRFGLGGDETIAITFGTPDGQTCYAWTARGEAFKSTNRGLEWTAIRPPWQGGVRLAVAFDKFNPSSAVAIVNAKDGYHTADGGGTWARLQGVDIPFDVTALNWNSSTGILLAGARGEGVKSLSVGPLLAAPLQTR